MDNITIERWQDPSAPQRRGLKLSGSLTVAQAAGVKEELLVALGESSELTVDLKEVTEVDLTALQLFAAAERSALAAGKGFVVDVGDNEIWRQCVMNAGFQRQPGCDVRAGQSIWAGGEC